MINISLIFDQNDKGNQLDNLIVDIEELYKKFPIKHKVNPKANSVDFNRSIYHKIYRNPFLPMKLRNNFWYLVRRLHLDLTWFNTLRQYWTQLLGGRPLWGIEDFFFCRIFTE